MPGPLSTWCFTLNGPVCLASYDCTNVILLPASHPLHAHHYFFIPATDSSYLCMFHHLLVTSKLILIALHMGQSLLVSLGISLLHCCSWEHVRHAMPSMPRCGRRQEPRSVLCSLVLFPVHGLHWLILYNWGYIAYAFPPLRHSHCPCYYCPLSSI